MGHLSVKEKRATSYSILILLLLAVFTLSYFFYFVPANKKAIDQNGFQILRTVAGNIAEKAESHRLMFERYLSSRWYDANSEPFTERRGATRIDTIRKLVEANNSYLPDQQKIIADVNSVAYNGNLDSVLRPFPGAGMQQLSIHADDTEQVFTFVLPDTGRRALITITEPAENFLDNIFASQKEELFDAYVLGLAKGRAVLPLHTDPELGLRTDSRLDSLLGTGTATLLSGTSELPAEASGKKLFYFPFRLAAQQLVLFGFVRTDVYNKNLRHIPFYFVYPLTIIFLLLLFSFPILKFRIMDSNEMFRIRDIMLFGFSVFMTAGLLTLIIIHFLLWKGAEARAAGKLQVLSGQIRSRLRSEIEEAYSRMRVLDSLRNTDTTLAEGDWDRRDYMHTVSAFCNRDTGRYNLFERVSWINREGEQRIKVERGPYNSFINVEKRQYFNDLKRNRTVHLHHNRQERFTLEPVFNWYSSDFNICIGKKTGLPATPLNPSRFGADQQGRMQTMQTSDEWYMVLASKMIPLTAAIMPPHYGFCIINDAGEVLIHSDPNRNLRENLFRKIEPAAALRTASAARQVTDINEVLVYGKAYLVHFEPLEDLPFQIVTFYDKSTIVPINMRILLFALIFGFLTLITCIGLGLAIGRNGRSAFPMVYCPLDCLQWLMPQEREAPYYLHAIGFLALYSVALLAFIFGNSSYQNINICIPLLLILTPFNISLGLHTIRRAIRSLDRQRPSDEENTPPAIAGIVRRKNLRVLTVFVLLNALICYAFSASGYKISLGSYLFQGAVALWMVGYTVFPERVHGITRSLHRSPAPKQYNYRFGYAMLTTLLVWVLAVLPNALYTWYAHNQELIQRVKSEQLRLAGDIRSRSAQLADLWEYHARRSDTIPQWYLDSLLLSRGIYTLFNDRVSYAPLPDKPGTFEPFFENFYFNVTAKASAVYASEQSFADLKDSSDDNAWHWEIAGNRLNLQYGLPLYRVRPDAPAEPPGLRVSSDLPPRFVYLSFSNPVAALVQVLLILALFTGLFFWLRKNAEQLFLLKFVEAHETGQDSSGLPLATVFFKKLQKVDARLYTPGEYTTLTTARDNSQLITYEKQMADLVKKGELFFAGIWKSCSEKEKFLLYDFATDGLMNFKNAYEILSLLRRRIFVVHGGRLRLFSPAFRAFILTNTAPEEIAAIQQRCKENATWQAVRAPLVILLVGIASVLFFTQQGVFDKLLLLAGGITTLLSFISRFVGSGGKPAAPTN